MINAPYQLVLPLGTQYLMGVPLTTRANLYAAPGPATSLTVKFFLSLSNIEPATLGGSSIGNGGANDCATNGTEQTGLVTALAAFYTGVLTVAVLNANLVPLIGQVIYTCAQVTDQYWSALPTLVQAAQ